MDWTHIGHVIASGADALVPIVASIIMGALGLVAARVFAYIPAFARVYAEQAYRAKEVIFKKNIEDALRNGIMAAAAKGLNGGDKLAYAIDHAIRTNPEGYAHFVETSNMSRATLATMAEAAEVTEELEVAAVMGNSPVTLDRSQPE